MSFKNYITESKKDKFQKFHITYSQWKNVEDYMNIKSINNSKGIREIIDGAGILIASYDKGNMLVNMNIFSDADEVKLATEGGSKI